MKIYLKVILSLVVIFGVFAWAVDSARARPYSGTDLNLAVGQGTVTVTNPQAVPVDVQLVSAGTRPFTVASSIDGVSGSSTSQDTGNKASQLFAFAVPAGASDFTVTRGTNVSFVSTAPTKLDVYVLPLTESDTRTTIIVAAVVILGALYYISRTTNHRWISYLRGKPMPEQPVDQSAVTAAAGQGGGSLRAYGDNRADISTPSTPL